MSIKMIEKMSKFIGHSQYLFIRLNIKLEGEGDKNVGDGKINNKNNNKVNILKRRSIILTNENFFQKRCKIPVRKVLFLFFVRNVKTLLWYNSGPFIIFIT